MGHHFEPPLGFEALLLADPEVGFGDCLGAADFFLGAFPEALVEDVLCFDVWDLPDPVALAFDLWTFSTHSMAGSSDMSTA